MKIKKTYSSKFPPRGTNHVSKKRLKQWTDKAIIFLESNPDANYYLNACGDSFVMVLRGEIESTYEVYVINNGYTYKTYDVKH